MAELQPQKTVCRACNYLLERWEAKSTTTPSIICGKLLFQTTNTGIFRERKAPETKVSGAISLLSLYLESLYFTELSAYLYIARIFILWNVCA